ncbi:hypothetical protein F5884DRAFT_25425 [Xylogone sp. PMI_703]|nr:hypothetical protein F5884DRAFT_25425 [Xylogone sp. PMI_703]
MSTALVRSVQNCSSSVDLERPPLRKTGRNRSHVKTGCKTCKIRRIKCDEQKPSCQRCLSTGRKCDGYGIWSLSRPSNLVKHQSLSKYNAPVPIIAATQDERGYFEYYLKSTSLKIPGTFESDFWDSIVLQASSVEPAVFHAATAVASAQRAYAARAEKRIANLPSTDISQNHDRFTLKQYNKAIKSLASHFSSNELSSLRVVMISCIVFASLEMLRGEYNMVGVHIRNGIDLLKKIQEHGETVAKLDTRLLQPKCASVDSSLAEAFTLLTAHLFPFGDRSQQEYFVRQDLRFENIPKIPPTFLSIFEMKHYLDTLLGFTIDLNRRAIDMDQPLSPPSPILIGRQRKLQEAFCDWRDAFDISAPSIAATVSPRVAIGIQLLGYYSLMMDLILETCFSSIKQTTFDLYTSSFESIIKEAIGLAVASGANHSSENPALCEAGDSFTVEMGYYQPLNYTALKCRVPSIRREAIRLLELAPHREGIWNGPLLARVAKSVIELEERNFSGALHMRSQTGMTPTRETEHSDKIDADFVLPEFARFHFVDVVLPKDEDKKGTLVCRRFKHEAGEGWEVVNIEIDFSNTEK